MSREEELQELHNQGQQDASNGVHNPPHESLAQQILDATPLGWIAAPTPEMKEEDRNAYQAGHQHTTEQKESTSSGCYLTTACTQARGLPDNCLELMTLRGFRDSILMRDLQSRKEVTEYYRTAPGIVATINANKNAASIWNKVYGDVRTAVTLVRRGDYQKAFKHYKKMTMRLKSTHLG